MFDSTPSAAVGEIGLDKGSRGKQINFTDQVGHFHLKKLNLLSNFSVTNSCTTMIVLKNLIVSDFE